ncbi:superoxide dismutase [Bacillus massiliglaciei]|uniref:superoxide dismutase n=1 Tax=Bacillus massiliglaciei TaxID=1816693 RepID=UPI000A55CCDD|nr:superoxide dismutase [Bacillus massiliglaciei]
MTEWKPYVQEVLEWTEEIREIVSETGLENHSLLSGIERLNLLTEEFHEKELSQEDVRLLEEEVRSIFEEVQGVLNESYGRQPDSGNSVPAGGHVLPKLPYSYEALEPVISREIMKLHHDVHHKAYVDGLNRAENKMKEARRSNDFTLLKHWEREAAFHGSGHYLHTLFWEGMSPKGGGRPKGELLRQIEKDFGSFPAFQKHFSEAAKQVEGVGWALLVWSPRSRRLEILQSERHMILTQWDTIPILVLDVWEHAYYLQYKTNRGHYVDRWWELVNWPHAAERLSTAKKLDWKPA